MTKSAALTSNAHRCHQKNVGESLEEGEHRLKIEETQGAVIGEPIAIARELTSGVHMAGHVGGEDPLVGEQEREVLPKVVHVADHEEPEHDPIKTDRARVFELQPPPPPSLASEHEQGDDRDRPQEHQPPGKGTERARLLVGDLVSESE